MLREIGSNFWLDSRELELRMSELDFSKIKFEIGDYVLLSTGRSAISFVLKIIKQIKGGRKLTALIPPFTCDTVIQPFLNEGVEVFAYDIDEKLYIDAEALKASIDRSYPDIVLMHRYFGFNTASEVDSVIKEYQSKAVFFIEDRTQNLFSSFSSLPVDYIVGSIRKWCAIPDGGYCFFIKDKPPRLQKPKAVDKELIEAKLKAFYLKYEYMINEKGKKDDFLKAYNEAEQILNSKKKFYKMSEESIGVFNNLNCDELSLRRRENYKYVYDSLREMNNFYILTEELQDGVVPLYLAVTSPKRNQIKSWLGEHAIYAPILWPKPKVFPEISGRVQELYDQVLCLPIDQRYDLDDMERMVKLLKEFNFIKQVFPRFYG